jgi:hypothetical protein
MSRLEGGVHGRSAELPENTGPLQAQLRAASGRSSKLLKDPDGFEAVVEVPERGALILSVQGWGGYSLRACTETQNRGQEAAGGALVAVGVLGSEGSCPWCKRVGASAHPPLRISIQGHYM